MKAREAAEQDRDARHGRQLLQLLVRRSAFHVQCLGQSLEAKPEDDKTQNLQTPKPKRA